MVIFWTLEMLMKVLAYGVLGYLADMGDRIDAFFAAAALIAILCDALIEPNFERDTTRLVIA
eukprot:5500435-Prymnesium_polylepis.1